VRLIYIKIDDPCCPSVEDVTVSEFQKGSLTMKDALQGGRRIAHFFFLPDAFDFETITIESWLKAPAHSNAEPPKDLVGLVQVDVLLGDRIEDIAQMAQYAKPERKKTSKKSKKKSRR
jgi:hypothetical protein